MVIRVFSGWSVRRGLNRDLVHCPWLCCRDQFTRFTSHLWTTFLYLFWMYWILRASLLLHGSMGYSVHLVQNYATKFSIMIYKYIILLSKKKKKIRVFLWRVCRDYIPTKIRLQSKGIECPASCLFCQQNLEIAFNCFFTCLQESFLFGKKKACETWSNLSWLKLNQSMIRISSLSVMPTPLLR